jgi:hypothetical protein
MTYFASTYIFSEETLRFMCIIENFHPKNATKASNNAEFHLPKTANRFKEISPTSFDQLDELHINAWKAVIK